MTVYYTTQFKRDYKKLKKQNKDIVKLRIVIQKLTEGQILDQKYRDHPLIGDWQRYRDCHIEPDWILIYKRTKDSLILTRTGSHAELFKK